MLHAGPIQRGYLAKGCPSYPDVHRVPQATEQSLRDRLTPLDTRERNKSGNPQDCTGSHLHRRLVAIAPRRYGQIAKLAPAHDDDLPRTHTKVAVRQRREHGTLRIRSVIAKQVDQRGLYSTFPRHATRTDQPQRFVQGRFISPRSGIHNYLGHLNDVGRQCSVADRILSHKLQQRWILKVIPAFKNHPLLHQTRMFHQIAAQKFGVSWIEQFYGKPKGLVFNSLLIRQSQVAPRHFSSLPPEGRPRSGTQRMPCRIIFF